MSEEIVEDDEYISDENDPTSVDEVDDEVTDAEIDEAISANADGDFDESSQSGSSILVKQPPSGYI